MADAVNTATTVEKNWPLLRTYAAVVQKGRRTIEQIPETYRADVQAVINGTLAE
jgi:hypothetical protein